MSFDAWRSVVGALWRQFALYPGGLALALVAAGWWLLRRDPAAPRPRAPSALLIVALALPWAAVALLPLPAAGADRAPLDLLAFWLLLESPLLLALAASWRAPLADQWWAVRALSALLVAAPLQAALLVALSTQLGTLALAELPGIAVAAPLVRWGLALLWLLHLPPLLHLGPWRAPIAGPWAWPLAARAAAHLALGSLVLRDLLPFAPGRLMTLAVVALLGLVALLFDRLSAGVAVQTAGRRLWLGAGALAAVVLLATLGPELAARLATR